MQDAHVATAETNDAGIAADISKAYTLQNPLIYDLAWFQNAGIMRNAPRRWGAWIVVPSSQYLNRYWPSKKDTVHIARRTAL